MCDLRKLALGLACLTGLASPALAHGHGRGPVIAGCIHETAATSYSKVALERASNRIIQICEGFLLTAPLQYADDGGRTRGAAEQLAASAYNVRLFIDYPDRVPGAVQQTEQSWWALSGRASQLDPRQFGAQARGLREIDGLLQEMRAELRK